jgi:hypothetical protein
MAQIGIDLGGEYVGRRGRVEPRSQARIRTGWRVRRSERDRTRARGGGALTMSTVGWDRMGDEGGFRASPIGFR